MNSKLFFYRRCFGNAVLIKERILLLVCIIIAAGVDAQVVNYTPLYTDATFRKEVDLGLPVGLTEGSHSVTAMGAATYTIPIKVAPGTHGMVPAISINYNSQSGAGTVGYGWNISGISSISRTPLTHYYDNANAPVKSGSNMNIALDGSRLLPSKYNGTGCVSEFMTECADYSFVRPMEASCDSYEVYNPFPTGLYAKVLNYKWLEAVSKDNKLFDYGSTTDSREMADDGTTIYSWLLSKVTDESGNYMTYNYTVLNGERVLTEIRYTGNSSMQPYNSVKFIYGVRVDANTLYMTGKTTQKVNVLLRVEVYAEGQMFHSYDFSYGKSEGYAMLKEVVEKGSDGNQFNSTIFKYGNLQDGSYVTDPISCGPDYTVCDVDGDGINDVVVSQNITGGSLCSSYNTGYKVYKGNASGANFQLYSTVTLPNTEFLSSTLNLGSGSVFIGKTVNPNPQKLVSTDFDGDGRDDIIRIGGYVQIINNKCYNSENRMNYINVLYSSGGGQFNVQNYGLPPYGNANYEIKANSYMQIGDFDGDKMPEVVLTLRDVNNGYANRMFIFNKRLNAVVALTGTQAIYDAFDRASMVFTGDFDGDGDQELYVKHDQYVNVYRINSYNYGANYSIEDVAYLQLSTADHILWSVFPGDFNGDGITDLAYSGKGDLDAMNYNYPTMYVTLGTGTGFTPQYYMSEYASHDKYQDSRDQGHFITADWMMVGDYNGDGKSDILHEYRGNYNGSYRSEIDVYYSQGVNVWSVKSYEQNFAFPDRNGAQAVDLNGDNRTDIFTDTKLLTFRPNIADKSVEKIRNGMGNETVFEYDALNRSSHFVNDHTSYGNHLVTRSAPMPGVTRVSINSGLDGISPTVTDYYYKNSVFHRMGKGFLGYRSFTGKDVIANKSIETENKFQVITTPNPNIFNPNPIVKVLPAGGINRISSISPAQTLSETVQTMVFKPHGNPNIFLPDNKTQVSTDYLSGISTTTSTVFDNYANEATTDVTMSNGLESTNTTNTFSTVTSYNNPYPAKVELQTVTRTRQGAPTLIDKTFFEYMGGGLLYRKTDFYGLPKAITTEYSRNAAGNILTETVSSTGLVSKTNQYQYDPKNRFVTIKINPLGQYEYYEYDAKWGMITKSTDIEKEILTYQYDGFGRLLSTNYPSYSITEQLDWNVDPSCNGLYQKNVVTPGKTPVVTQLDALGRVVRVSTAVWGTSFPSPMGPVTFPNFSTVDVTYDNRGNKATETQPHYSWETNYLTTVYSYDWLNRLQSTYDYLHDYTSYGYTYASGNLTTTVTNAVGQVSATTTDATDKVIGTSDMGGKIAFEYDSRGKQLKAIPLNLASNAVKAVYDDYSRQTQLTDPNSGTIKYEYNAWGELTSQTDANNNTQTMQYDILGRIISRTGAEGTTLYGYYNGVNAGEGNNLKNVTDFNGNTESYIYDAYGRLIDEGKVINGRNFRTMFAYDIYDRLQKTTYYNLSNGNVEISNTYNTMGTLNKVLYNGYPLYECGNVDALGHPISYTRGGNMQTTKTYDYGYLTNTVTPGYQNYSLQYDYYTGNITDRIDFNKSIMESFAYDGLDRLLQSTVMSFGGPTTFYPAKTVTYHTGTALSSNGNIKTKSDVGAYGYGGKPHAVNYVDNTSSTIPNIQQDVKYTPFRKTLSVEEGQWKQTFQYDADYERNISNLYQNGTLVKQRIYAGNGLEVHKNVLTGAEKEILYIPGGDGVCTILTVSGGNPELWWPFADHLGSIQTLVDEDNNIAYEQNFDAWGRYRNWNNWQLLGGTYTPAGNEDPAWSHNDVDWLHGFTGHEHLPQFGLINMNARMYDPVLGRMLAPDNFIGNPKNTQSYNKYSYANNNPLKYVDPDGNNGVAIGAIYGAAKYLIQAGTKYGGLRQNFNWEQMAISTFMGAWSGGMSSAIGGYFAEGGIFHINNFFLNAGANALAHGGASYITSGGDASAFYTGTFSAFASSIGYEYGGSILRTDIGSTIFSAGIGGVSSSMSGGSFWEGAAEAALIHMTNQLMHKYTPAPKTLPGFPGSGNRFRHGGRYRWKLPDGRIGEWDSQHGEVEVYDKTGKRHDGAYDPNTGQQVKPPVDGRKTNNSYQQAPTHDNTTYYHRYLTPGSSPTLHPATKTIIGVGIGVILIDLITTYGPVLILL